MKQKDVLTKILAISGTVLVWLPILAPVLFSAGLLFRAQLFRFDYLMPAEFSPVALAGGGLLVWAALRRHAHTRLIAWSLGISIVMLVGGQALAVVTGLADGRIEPTGWQWVLVLGSIVVFLATLILIGIGGILLLRDLFRPAGQPTREL
jgi:hypothetical protein